MGDSCYIVVDDCRIPIDINVDDGDRRYIWIETCTHIIVVRRGSDEEES